MVSLKEYARLKKKAASKGVTMAGYVRAVLASQDLDARREFPAGKRVVSPVTPGDVVLFDGQEHMVEDGGLASEGFVVLSGYGDDKRREILIERFVAASWAWLSHGRLSSLSSPRTLVFGPR